MLKIEIRFTEIAPSTHEGFRIPMNTGNVYPDYHRENGSTARVVDFNRLIITTPHYTEEYAVSFELSGTDTLEAMKRNTADNIRFWKAVEGVVMARLSNLVRYINRHTW